MDRYTPRPPKKVGRKAKRQGTQEAPLLSDAEKAQAKKVAGAKKSSDAIGGIKKLAATIFDMRGVTSKAKRRMNNFSKGILVNTKNEVKAKPNDLLKGAQRDARPENTSFPPQDPSEVPDKKHPIR
jgi:hypothetical protein